MKHLLILYFTITYILFGLLVYQDKEFKQELKELKIEIKTARDSAFLASYKTDIIQDKWNEFTFEWKQYEPFVKILKGADKIE